MTAWNRVALLPTSSLVFNVSKKYIFILFSHWDLGAMGFGIIYFDTCIL